MSDTNYPLCLESPVLLAEVRLVESRVPDSTIPNMRSLFGHQPDRGVRKRILAKINRDEGRGY